MVSDDQEKVMDKEGEIPVYHLSEVPCKPKESAVVIAVGRQYQGVFLQNLKKFGYFNIL